MKPGFHPWRESFEIMGLAFLITLYAVFWCVTLPLRVPYWLLRRAIDYARKAA